MLAPLIDTLVFVAGALAIVAAVRWWRCGSDGPPKRWAAFHALLVFAFLAVPLVTGANQAPVDIAYQFQPWRFQTPRDFAPDNTLLSDIPLQMVPFRTLVRERLLAGEAPLWSHELGTGQPLLGNAQSAPFAPLHLGTLMLPPVRALTVAASWQLLLGALLMHCLVLTLSRRDEVDGPPAWPNWTIQAGAALAAVAFAFSTYSIAWLYHPLSMVAMWIPGVVLGIVALARGERRALPGLVVCAWALAVSGHPETAAHTALLAAGLGAGYLIVGPPVGRLRFVARAALAAFLAAGFAAPALLPVLEILPESERKVILEDLGQRPMGMPELEPAGLLPAVDPLVFGSPRDGDWDGPSNFNEYASQYAGAATLALALAGLLVLVPRRGFRWTAVGLAAALCALLASLKVPPFYDLVEAIPGLEHAAHGRLRLFWVLAVALLAGLALPRLARSRIGPQPGWVGWVAGTVGLIAVAGVLLAAPPPFGSLHQRAWWWVALAGLAAVAASLTVPKLRRAVPAVALAAVVLDLFVLGVRYHATVPARFDLSPETAPPALAFLMEEQAASREPFRVSGEGIALFPNLPAAYGLWGTRGNDPMQPRAASLLVRRRLGLAYQPGTNPSRPAFHDPGVFRMLGVRYLVTPKGRSLPEADWRLALQEGGVRVWRLERPLPLFFVPGRSVAVVEPERARVAAFRTRDFARRAVYLDPEGGVRGDGPIPPSAAVEQEGRVWIREVRPNGFDLTVESDGGMVVASSVSRVRGWRLAIDGEPAEVLTVNSGFVGFRAPPGVHAVSLEYAPAGWRWGWALFGVAGMVAFGLALRSRRAFAAGSS